MKPVQRVGWLIGCAMSCALLVAACGPGPREAPEAEAPARTAEQFEVDFETDDTAPMAAFQATAFAAEETVERKIVYTASVSLRVERFEGIPNRVRQLALDHGGYIANERLESRPARPRNGEWTVRVPVEQYEAFLEAVTELGDLDSLRQEAEEVTEEYYDVQARIENKEREEARLIDLLEHETADLEDVLKVEQALSSVREEIERRQGRLRVLRNQIALSTVTVSVNEVRGYIPEEQIGFFARLSRAWDESLSSLLAALQWLVIALTSAAPWLVVFGLPLLIVAVLVRRRIRLRAARRG